MGLVYTFTHMNKRNCSFTVIWIIFASPFERYLFQNETNDHLSFVILAKTKKGQDVQLCKWQKKVVAVCVN